MLSLCKCSHSPRTVRPFILCISLISWLFSCTPSPQEWRSGCACWIPSDEVGDRVTECRFTSKSAVLCPVPTQVLGTLSPVSPEKKERAGLRQERDKMRRQAVSCLGWEVCPGPMLWEAKRTPGMHNPDGRKGFEQNNPVSNTDVSDQFLKLFLYYYSFKAGII